MVGHRRVDRVQISDALPRTNTEPNFECVLLVPYFLSLAEQRDVDTSRYFHPTMLKRLTREFDLTSRYAIAPTRHQPGNQARDHLKKLDREHVHGNAFPLSYSLEIGINVAVGVSLDEFGPGNFVLRAKVTGILNLSDLETASINAGAVLRELTAAPFRDFLAAAGRLAFGTSTAKIGHAGRTSVHSKLLLSATEDEAAEYISSRRAELIALHISRDPTLIPDPRLSSAIIRANSELNLKSESQLLILNAQGSTLVSSADRLRPTPYYNNRFERVVDLSEIGLCMQQALLFSPVPVRRPHGTQRVQRTQPARRAPASSFGALPLIRWVEYPENVFYTSVSNRKVWEVISSSLHLKSLVSELREIDGVNFQ